MSSDRKSLRVAASSLRIRIPIIITVMMLLNMLILYLFYQFFYAGAIAEKIFEFSGREISARALRSGKLLISVMGFEMVLILVILVAVGFIINFIYARPLDRLYESVRHYREHSVPETTRNDEIGELQNAFAQMSRELEAEKQLQSRMIAGISHDVKTPLTSVLGYSESLLKKDLPPERVRQYLAIIHSGAKSIEAILEEFDGYIEGKLIKTLSRKNLMLTFIENMLREEYKNELRQRGVLFFVDNGCAADAAVSADLAKVRRVFANLIGNAIRHNQLTEGLKIQVEMHETDGGIIFSVRDNGVGLEEISHIFEPFYTTDKGRTVSGLGLSICRNIVESHGGAITALNRPEGGAEFTFTLE